jgi:hypothetical protein
VATVTRILALAPYAPVEARTAADRSRAHGHGVIERVFVGSTTQHVVRRTSCPVLVVRQRPNEGHG